MDRPLTEKSRAVITEAQGQALDRDNVTLEPEHVLYALVAQADGLGIMAPALRRHDAQTGQDEQPALEHGDETSDHADEQQDAAGRET